MENNFFNQLARLCNREHELTHEILYRKNRNLETTSLENELNSIQNRIELMKEYI